jgi:GTP pyrophosphokinase
MGFVTRGQGVSVHRTDCPNAKALTAQSERLIEVSWRTGKPTSFVVAVQVEALDRTRLLSDVATVLSDHHVNILSATSAVGRDRTTILRFTFELADITHLAEILTAAKKVENVYDAFRVVPRYCASSSSGSPARPSPSEASSSQRSVRGCCSSSASAGTTASASTTGWPRRWSTSGCSRTSRAR